MLLANEKNIREVTMFPMNQNAQDLMMNAPSNVSENQLKELGAAYSSTVMGETGAPGSLDVATLARADVLEIRTHRNYSIPHPDGGWTKFSREFLEVHMDWKGWRIAAANATCG